MRSDAVKTGTQQAPHRSLFIALGMTKEEMDRPLVGIVHRSFSHFHANQEYMNTKYKESEYQANRFLSEYP